MVTHMLGMGIIDVWLKVFPMVCFGPSFILNFPVPSVKVN